MAYIPDMEEKRSLRSIPDHELLQRLAALTSQSRRVEVDIVAHIAEVEKRRLYAREAFPSMFVYCKDVLHLSEQEAYLRIAVARASRKHPTLLTMLGDGRLHLSAIALLAPHLTPENREGLLERATHRSKRQVEELIAELAPRPDAPAMVRRLPERRPLPAADSLVVSNGGERPTVESRSGPTVERLGPDRVVVPDLGSQPSREFGVDGIEARGPGLLRPQGTAVASPISPPVLQALSPGRYKVQFTASAEFRRKLERLRALMGSGRGDGDLAAVIEQAVTEKLERLEARRFARRKDRGGRVTAPAKPLTHSAGRPETERRPDPSHSSRHIPAAVRRAVYQRDGGRCSYVDEQCRRCSERDRLQYHHRHPFGLGGDDSVANIALMCAAHNAFLAECDYGKDAMARRRHPLEPPAPAPSG